LTFDAGPLQYQTRRADVARRAFRFTHTAGPQSSNIRWGILGTGAIARCFVQNLAKSRTGTLAAVGSRTQESADKFVAAHGSAGGGGAGSGVRAHGSYAALLADLNVDAVYVCPPHTLHAEWSIKAAGAGKHVLCEKPMAPSAAEAMAIFEAAEIARVMAVEAFMYRCHPQTAKLVEVIKSGAIGEVRLINAPFSFDSGFNPDSRLYRNDLAGGGILDVGCYAASIARLIAGAAVGEPFADPTHVSGTANLAPTGVDAWAAAVLKFKSGIVAQLSTGVNLNQDNVVRVFGSKGNITLPDPYLADRQNPPQGKIVITRGGKTEEIAAPSEQTSFTLEADAFGDALLAGRLEPAYPAMSPADTLGNLRTLDRWRQTAGVQFDIETPKAYPKTTVSGEPLRVRDNNMRYVPIPGIAKQVSCLAMGCDNQQTLAHAAIMFDDFYERGGTLFDTGYIYGGGLQERLLGDWMKLRGVREQVNVIVKGCHTPEADPISLTRQLRQSLDRLKTDYADIYMMHRDNTDYPVSAFVDVLNEHKAAGRIKAFGGSNWTLERVQEANDYARANGLEGFTVVSNNFSLARMVEPIWAGCVAASDDASRAWFTNTQTALLSWSSQARGFFLPGRAAPDKTDDKELVRTWYAPDNFQRLERANELAKKKNVSPINIALAYVLSQPFPTIALIGPRLLSETRTSLPGLDVTLSAEELKWLNLEA
jgi:predicted dehydrogenase/aryl-alcohol dehydrogenase-like predicted oxidoreductase